MKRVVPSSKLPPLSQRQLARMSEQFGGRQNVMPHELANKLGANSVLARAILLRLAALELVTMYLVIYHDCQALGPVHVQPMSKGYPLLPWTCPECGDTVTDADELSYEVMAKSPRKIEFA